MGFLFNLGNAAPDSEKSAAGDIMAQGTGYTAYVLWTLNPKFA